MTKRLEIHERVLHAPDRDALMEVYAEWADRYDVDLVDGEGYVGHREVAQLLAPKLPAAGARVLDAGCGTGLVGIELAGRCEATIVGADYSPAMLARAKATGVYDQLLRLDLNEPLPLPDDSFDAVVCAGTLTVGHVGPGALVEFVRVVEPGGHVCFTVREEAWQQDDYQTVIDGLDADGRWTVEALREADYIREEGSRCHLCLYRIS
ncbi:MAG: class I SAM-dependent methyltransferase [Pseudomonadales bacterium]|jgi:predicted TPR repeat methyltransferase|nr:class I SAM-dependent methyltransferase [Pseudomonadales bacterium]